MRRLLFAVVVAVGVVLCAGVSLAQEEGSVPTPQSIQKFLDKFIGTWSQDAGSEIESTIVFRWGSGKNNLILENEFIYIDGARYSDLALMGWDGLSEDGSYCVDWLKASMLLSMEN